MSSNETRNPRITSRGQPRHTPGTRTRERRGNRGLPLHPLVVGRPGAEGFRCTHGKTPVAGGMAIARRTCVLNAPDPSGADHRDAVDGAGRDAEPAAGAHRDEDRVHPLRRARDRVDGAGFDAKRATDAGRLVDPGDRERRRLAAGAIERKPRTAGQRCKLCDEGLIARRAAIDGRAVGDRFRVGAASRVTAAPALRLRQQGIDAIDN